MENPGGVELPALSNNNDQDTDDYHNAIMGNDTYEYDASNRGFQDIDVDADAAAAAGGGASGKNSNLTKPLKKSGIAGTSANLVNSIVGAGIIGIPNALKQSGLLAGLFLLILVAYLTDKSLRIIVGLASFHPRLRNQDVRTFEDLASYPFGNLGSNFILANMFIAAYGAMVAYLLIIKDTVPHVLGVHSQFERTLIMIATSASIMVPLSMQRDMASLSITSLFSVLADVILVGFIVAYSPIQESVDEAGGFGQVLVNDSINPTIFIGLGILSTAMACQHSAFIVSGSLENKTMSRWSRVTGFSISISAVLCAILGVSGYLGFMDETQGDVLNNFADDSVVANGARSLLAITMFFTYPMESFVARHVLVQLFNKGDMDGRDDPAHSGRDGDEAGGYLTLNRRQTWTLAIYFMALLPALLVDDLGPVLSITGSLGGGCIAYMAPGLAYLGVNGEEFLSYASSLLARKQSGSGAGSGAMTEADLPVAGDSQKVMSTEDTLMRVNKPFWWYLAGFPLWCSIASLGASNMKKRLDSEGNGVDASPQDVIDDDLIDPNGKEFCIAICFIVFGVVTIFAGVGSNIYVEVTEMY